MTVSRRKTLRATLAAATMGTLLAGVLVPGTATAASADVTLINAASTNWKYLDDNTDPAQGLPNRTDWTAATFSDSAWKDGKSPFGAKSGKATSSNPDDVGGTNFPVTTLLNQYINGTAAPNVPAFFFRTSVNLSQDVLDTAVEFDANIKYDDAATVYVNGTKVAGFDDGSITENLQYGGSNADKPKLVNFDIPANLLQAGTNTVAVELHQGRESSSDVYFEFVDLTAKFAPDAVTISDVVLNIGADQTQRNVAWYTNEPADQSVQVALASAASGLEFPAANAQTFAATSGSASDGQYYHHATITGLQANTAYVYRVGDEANGWSETYSFKTLNFTDDYSFIFVGDPQIGASGNVTSDRTGWVNTLNTAEDKFPNTHFVFSAGDQVEHAANESEYEAFLAPEQLRSLPLVPVNGNHDVGSLAYEQHFNQPNLDQSYGSASSATSSGGDYWFKYNDVLYVVLNSNSRDHASHAEFMTKVVQEQGQDAKWKVLAFHHSIYSVAAHTNDSDIVDRRENMPETISELGFDLVLMGHDHSYTRSWLMNDGEPVEVGGTAQSEVEAHEGDVLYVTANSASGSKYYSVRAPEAPFAAVINQENKRNYSNVEVTDKSIKVTTFRSDDNTVVDEVTLKRADVTKPELSVPGDVTVKFGEDFDPMAEVSAVDDVDGDLTSLIEVTGEVNTSELGQYTLTYKVTDAAGNSAEATRVVSVVKNTLDAVIPKIAGTAKVDQKLSVQAGSWPQGTTLSYRWLANDKPIAGAEGTSLALTPALEGKSIRVQVTAVLHGYEDASAVSAPVRVAAGTLSAVKPRITGKPKVGKTLRVNVGAWSKSPALAVRWYVGGKPVQGAKGTKTSFTLKKKQVGKRISVRVTAVKTGYQPVTVTSDSTKKVAAKKKAAAKKSAAKKKAAKKRTAKAKSAKKSVKNSTVRVSVLPRSLR